MHHKQILRLDEVIIPREQNLRDAVTRAFPNVKVETIRKLSGGTTNALYKVDLTNAKGLSTVLVRINGVGTSHIIDREQELSVLSRAYKQGVGPEVYCVFDNGIIYQYFEGVPLSLQEMRSYAEKIAAQLAKLHEIDIGDRKSGESALVNKLWKWVSKARKVTVKKKEEKPKIDLDVLEHEIRAVTDAVRDFEIGLCHNDLTGINIIYKKEVDRMTLIDFEYCCYNYVAYDIANHFCEYPGYTEDRSLYPTEEEQTKFIRAYLTARTNVDATEEAIEKLKQQTRICALLSNLNWCVWGIIQAQFSAIDFDYWRYAEERLDWYYELKAKYGFDGQEAEQ